MPIIDSIPTTRSVIRNTLIEASLYSEAAVELLMLTAAVESHVGRYLKGGRGPAMGMFQIEPATEKDIYNHYLYYKTDLAKVVDKFKHDELKYHIILARIIYLRTGLPLPNKNDTVALAKFWKKHYNTYKGKGTVKKAVEAYEVYALRRA